ncbi:hypothetical protein T440DRAFT_542719 [Plenodomus tracheiphilus IPT5]|uniref:Uncharacterized protein n=1 Tax=Plenodomus tracheiphilus IPT5 TaxID=1408161 RepID=A0A6A7AST1_9PLEO|nr:hypothetical protein T440DRAFT_542719 [Plenodomus tracheiphilus IPT5]
MPSNRNRLYIFLYPSGVVNNKERKYNWGFLIRPKVESKNVVLDSQIPVKNVRTTNSLLARILIAKIEDEQRLIALLRGLPVVKNDSNCRCRTWIANVLAEIAKDGKCVGTAELGWAKIEAFARQYVRDKTASGLYQSMADLMKPKPT